MKKILLTLLLLIPVTVLADNNVVTFMTSFDESVDVSLINDISVLYTDKTEVEYSVTLKKEENYYYSYDLYNGSDILKVIAILNNDELNYESSVETVENGYLIHLNITKKEEDNNQVDNNQDIVIGTPQTTTTKVTSSDVVENKTTTEKTTKIEFTSDDKNNFIRIIFIISISILGIFVLLFIGYATIKIVNANK